MHGSIRDRLEDLLSAGRSAEGHEIVQHLSSCAECSSEVAQMRTQNELLHTLKPPTELEPVAGFYARVMQRIEERAKESIWAVFIYSPFGKRLAYASLGFAIVLGTYIIAEETRDGHLGKEQIVAQRIDGSDPVIGNQAQQRDAVLVNFASTEGTLQ